MYIETKDKPYRQRGVSTGMNDRNLLRPRLCDACEAYVIDTLNAEQRLDVHYCVHNKIFAQLRFRDGRLADTMLTGPITRDEVGALLADAAQTVALQRSQQRRVEDSVN